MTDEPPRLVDEWFEKNQPTYPVVAMKNDDLEKFLGVQGFPTAAVFRPDGKLAYSGFAGGEANDLQQALRKARRSPLFPKAFKKVMAAMEEGEYGESYSELRTLIGRARLEGSDAAVAENLRVHHEQLGTQALEAARAHLKEGRVYHAAMEITPFARSEVPYPETESFQAVLDELESSPDFKREMKGGALYAEAEEHEEEGDYVAAVKAYKAAMKKASRTRIADLAERRARELIESGKPGWDPTCSSCKFNRDGSACKKHKKKMKL